MAKPNFDCSLTRWGILATLVTLGALSNIFPFVGPAFMGAAVSMGVCWMYEDDKEERLVHLLLSILGFSIAGVVLLGHFFFGWINSIVGGVYSLLAIAVTPFGLYLFERKERQTQTV